MEHIHFISPSQWWYKQSIDGKSFWRTFAVIMAIVFVFIILMVLGVIEPMKIN